MQDNEFDAFNVNDWTGSMCIAVRQFMLFLVLPQGAFPQVAPETEARLLAHLQQCVECNTAFEANKRINTDLQALFIDPPFDILEELLAAEKLDPLDAASNPDAARALEPPIQMTPDLLAAIDAVRRGEDITNDGSVDDPTNVIEAFREGETDADHPVNTVGVSNTPTAATPANHTSDVESVDDTLRRMLAGKMPSLDPPARHTVISNWILQTIAIVTNALQVSLNLTAQQLQSLQCVLGVTFNGVIAPVLMKVAESDERSLDTVEACVQSGFDETVQGGRVYPHSTTTSMATNAATNAAVVATPATAPRSIVFVSHAHTDHPTAFRDLLQQGGQGRPVIQSLPKWGSAYTVSGQIPEHIVGMAPSLDAAIELLSHAAAANAPVGATPCIVTWLADRHVFDAAPPFLHGWDTVLRRLVERGWDILHLVGRSQDSGQQLCKSIAIAKNLHALLGVRGRYTPHFVSPGSVTLDPMYGAGDTERDAAAAEYIIVPNLGAVTLYTDDEGSVTNARFTPPGRELDTLAHCFTSAARSAAPVYRACYRWPDRDYHQGIVQLEEQPGARYVLVDGLSDSMIPYIIHRQRAHRLREDYLGDVDRIDRVLYWQKRRITAVLRNMHVYQYCDVTSRQGIKRLVREGRYQKEDIWTVFGAAPLTVAQRRLVLSVLIRRLKVNPNYHLLLLAEGDEQWCRTDFMVKNGHGAIVEYWLTTASGKRVRSDVEIAEPAVVQAYGKALWDEVTARTENDKDHVIAFLQAQLDSISQC